MAANLNRVLLMGNLTADPELRYTPKGTAVADVRLAINRYFSGESAERQEETTFVDVTIWGRAAETAKQYLTKGRSVFIEGRLQLDTWEDKQTGQKRSRLRVVSENMQMLGAAGARENNTGAPQQNRGGYSQQNPGSYNNQPTGNYGQGGNSNYNGGGYPQNQQMDSVEMPDDDIPF